MGRILAFDFGLKRTGIAVTDELQLIASGLTTVNSKEVISYIEKYLQNENVELFVVGKPKNLDNNPSESYVIVEGYVEKLKNKFPKINVVEIDERFTSKMAFQTMIDSGIPKKKRMNKALIDEISATIILQSYLSTK